MIFGFCHAAAALRQRSAALATLASLALAATGCEPTYMWTGQIDGTDAVVGIALRDGVANGYLCGGPTTYATMTRWSDATVQGNGFYSDDFYGYISGSQVEGTFFVQNELGELFYTASEAGGDVAGLYEVEDSGCRTGVVVWEDSAGEPQLQGVWCDDRGNFAQVTPVRPIEKVDGAIHVQVDLGFLDLELRDLYVTPALPR